MGQSDKLAPTLDQLISEPLRALVHADVRAAEVSAEFIGRIGLVPALAILPLPLLRVKEAECDFAVRILRHSTRPPRSPAGFRDHSISPGFERFLSARSLELRGCFDRLDGSRLEPTSTIRMTLKIRVEHDTRDA